MTRKQRLSLVLIIICSIYTMKSTSFSYGFVLAMLVFFIATAVFVSNAEEQPNEHQSR